jgi:hypothetical protein
VHLPQEVAVAHGPDLDYWLDGSSGNPVR